MCVCVCVCILIYAQDVSSMLKFFWKKPFNPH